MSKPEKRLVQNFSLLTSAISNSQLTESSESSRVPAGVIASTKRSIDDVKADLARYEALAKDGGLIREIDTDLIDPSPFPDRLTDDDVSGFDLLKQSIQDNGQKVPIQVRRNIENPDRYQVVYGHRRLLAAKQLSIKVRAIEVKFSDADLVIAQGIENSSRQDLSWIEKALFASRMDALRIKPRDIYVALAIEDAELARMRKVCQTIPVDVIEAIGRAPKIGRPRWLELASFLSADEAAIGAVRSALNDRGASKETSDQRFQLALKSVKPKSDQQDISMPLLDSFGTSLAVCTTSDKVVRIAAEGDLGRDFLKFVEAQLPDLAERFASERNNPKP